jgi:hypothetical protein
MRGRTLKLQVSLQHACAHLTVANPGASCTIEEPVPEIWDAQYGHPTLQPQISIQYSQARFLKPEEKTTKWVCLPGGGGGPLAVLTCTGGCCHTDIHGLAGERQRLDRRVGQLRGL